MLNNTKLDLFLKKNKKKKIVLCHGVFDLLHIGHINYLKKAKSLGDVLIVSLTAKNLLIKDLIDLYLMTTKDIVF